MKQQEYVYAASLFSLAEEESCTDEVYDSLTVIGNALSEQPEFTTILNAPNVPRDERIKMADDAFGTLNVYAVNLLKILCEKRSVHRFPSCRAHFSKLRDEKNNVVHITVTTAYPLSEDQRTRLVKKLEAERGKHIVPTFKEDKSIIGGLIIEDENSRTNADVLSRLKAVRNRLLFGNKD